MRPVFDRETHIADTQFDDSAAPHGREIVGQQVETLGGQRRQQTRPVTEVMHRRRVGNTHSPRQVAKTEIARPCSSMAATAASSRARCRSP
jgi:hypothetical protein